ncbi:MAG TPA: hypothetical protein VM029_10050 [Opitutaceae bacterium]|nr:hypothetical protein [Opitutaceae bacterium]
MATVPLVLRLVSDAVVELDCEAPVAPWAEAEVSCVEPLVPEVAPETEPEAANVPLVEVLDEVLGEVCAFWLFCSFDVLVDAVVPVLGLVLGVVLA